MSAGDLPGSSAVNVMVAAAGDAEDTGASHMVSDQVLCEMEIDS